MSSEAADVVSLSPHPSRSGLPRVALSCLLLGACAHPAVNRPTRVAVLPLDGIGVPPGHVSRMDRTITRQIEHVAGFPVVDPSRVQRATSRSEVCRQRPGIPCSAEVGRAVEASHVVFGAVGRLGKTWVLRLKLLRVSESTVTRTVEETLFGPAGLDRSLAAVTRRLFDLPEPRPWYARWWIWTIAGVAVTAAAVAIPLAVTRGEKKEDPYQDIPFP